MARRDALLRLHKSLLTRREELRARLGGELRGLREGNQLASAGDSADQAFDSGSDEVNTQIAELESRELAQIERALFRLKQGTYGLCEGCHKKIPVARLNALPFSTTCIHCQREMEVYGTMGSRHLNGNWDKVSETESHLSESKELDLSSIEMDFTLNR